MKDKTVKNGEPEWTTRTVRKDITPWGFYTEHEGEYKEHKGRTEQEDKRETKRDMKMTKK